MNVYHLSYSAARAQFSSGRSLWCLVALLNLLAPGTLRSDHFLGGYLSWQPRPDLSPTSIEFEFVVNAIRNEVRGSAPDRFVAVGDVIPVRYGLLFGDEGPDADVHLIDVEVLRISTEANWYDAVGLDPITRERGIVHEYPTPTSGSTSLSSPPPTRAANRPAAWSQFASSPSSHSGAETRTATAAKTLPIRSTPSTGILLPQKLVDPRLHHR